MAKILRDREEERDKQFTELLSCLSDLRKEVRKVRTSVLAQAKPAYTNAELADMFDVTVMTLKKWRDSGTLSFSLRGSTYLYSKKDVDEFLTKNHYSFE